jgi:hypothetical protein
MDVPATESIVDGSADLPTGQVRVDTRQVCGGETYHLPGMDYSGLRPAVPSIFFLVRNVTLDIFAALEKSTFLQSEPSVSFATVRFVFLVPTGSLSTFRLPSRAVTLQAKEVLACGNWGFEQFGVTPSG